MLRYVGKLEVFDRSDGVPPIAILDGHISRFWSEYLDYCNDERHLWTPMIGIPYASNLWQIGDSSQHNGSFKIELASWKGWLRSLKEKHRYTRALIDRTYVMLLVRKAWARSFTRVESNKRAIQQRGFNPLTYNLLEPAETEAQIVACLDDSSSQLGVSCSFSKIGLEPHS
jgi:hypothetical protein